MRAAEPRMPDSNPPPPAGRLYRPAGCHVPSTAIVARSHIMHSQAAASLPSNQYAQMLMGKLGWGSKEYVARTAKRDHNTFEAGAVSRMNALQAGLYSPTLAAAAVSPELMSQRLLAPGRTRRFAVRPSPIGPGLGTPQT